MKQSSYRGWAVLVVGTLCMAIIFSSQASLPGIFTIPVTKDLHVTRTAFNLHISLIMLAAIPASLIIGKTLTKKNVRIYAGICTLMCAFCFWGYSSATRLWHFYVISTLFGFFGRGCTKIAVCLLVNDWFGPKLRGKMIGITMAGSSFGAILLNPLLSQINAELQWRASYRLLTLLALILVPLVWFSFVQRPQNINQIGNTKELLPQNKLVPKGVYVKQAMQRPPFWIIHALLFISTGVVMAFLANGVSFLTDSNLTALQAGSIMSVGSLTTAIGNPLLGGICDKLGVKKGVICVTASLGLGLAIITIAGSNLVVVCTAMLLIGFGNAAGNTMVPMILLDYYGDVDFAKHNGYSGISTGLGGAIGPILAVRIFDSFGSYHPAWILSAVLMLVFVCTILMLYRNKAKRRDYHGREKGNYEC